MDVVLALLLGENLLEWGGGLEEGGQKIGPETRWADDGKRFSDGRCIRIASRREFVRMGRRSGGGGAKNRTGPEGGRMTGSAFSDGRCIGIASRREFIEMGRRSGGGGGAKNST